VTVMPKRGGRKANLSPRVPARRKVSKLFVKKKLPDGTTRREVKHPDYATPAVVKALEEGGWKRPVSNAVEAAIEVTDFDEVASAEAEEAVMAATTPNFDELMALHHLSADIYHVVEHYISDARCQQAPKEFRPGAKAFHEALEAIVDEFPLPEAELAGALNDEIEKTDLEDVPDIELCRSVVLALFEASKQIQADEAGRGKHADRAKRVFFMGLAVVYEERTGRPPKRIYEPDEGPTGPFFAFVTAVNEQIPRRSLRLTDGDIDRLTRAYFPSN
jgi:hypothetical protein